MNNLDCTFELNVDLLLLVNFNLVEEKSYQLAYTHIVSVKPQKRVF
jgi:hypothetical protein